MPAQKVSVITPLYNSSRYIEETLNSLRHQTYENWESILIDDGSTDDTAQKVQPYLKDRRFRYLKQRNQGIAAARNTGIRVAGGVWLCLLDHDDRWLPSKLQKQIEFALAEGCDLMCTDALVIERDRRTLYHTLFPNDALNKVGRGLRDPNVDVFELLIQTNFLCASSVMIRRSFFDRLGLLDRSAAPADDYEMWLRCMPSAKIGYLDEPLIEYVLHDNNYSHNRIKMAEKVIYALSKHGRRFLRDEDRTKQFEESLGGQYRFLFSKLVEEKLYTRAIGHALLLSTKGRGGIRLLSNSFPFYLARASMGRWKRALMAKLGKARAAKR